MELPPGPCCVLPLLSPRKIPEVPLTTVDKHSVDGQVKNSATAVVPALVTLLESFLRESHTSHARDLPGLRQVQPLKYGYPSEGHTASVQSPD